MVGGGIFAVLGLAATLAKGGPHFLSDRADNIL